MAKLKVTSLPQTFRRAGLLFSREPREIEVDNKTVKLLKQEINLNVSVLPEEKKKTSGGSGDS